MPEGKPGKFSTAKCSLDRVNEQELAWPRTVGCCCELTASGEAICHEALEKDGVEVRTAEVDGSGVASRSRADDHLHRSEFVALAVLPAPRILTTLECILVLLGTVVIGAVGVSWAWWVNAAARGMTLERALKDDNACLGNSVEDFIRRRCWSRPSPET